MTRQPRAFFALDHGSATVSAALIAHVGERWRLVAHAAAPEASVGGVNGPSAAVLLESILVRVGGCDPDLLAEIAGTREPNPARLAEELARLEVRSAPPRRLAVVAASQVTARLLAAAAELAGWEVTVGSADMDDPLQLSRLMLAARTEAVLIGTADPPTAGERHLLRTLGAVAAAALTRRPGIPLVLAGGAAQRADMFHLRGGHGKGAPDGPGSNNTILAPAPEAGEPAGEALRSVLEGLRAAPDDARLATARSVRSLAYVLDRTVELVEVGMAGSLRCRAEPLAGDGRREVSELHATLASGGFAPADPTEPVLDAVQNWSAIPLDRHRLPDRLRDLRLAPWGDAAEDGIHLKLAAGRAALERLVAATPEIGSRPAPDLLVAAGGIWQSAPAPIVLLALADLVRRPGTSQLAIDFARLLGPLGAIEDEDERRAMLADLVDDMLLPLGSAIVAAGLRGGQSAGRLTLRRGEAVTEIDLEAGSIEVVDLPPGQEGAVDLEFHDTVQLGARGRRFAVEVTGGLGGLFVDLRDVPLQLPERAEERRGLLDSWQRALWPELDA